MEKTKETTKSLLSTDNEEIICMYIDNKIVNAHDIIIFAGKANNWKIVDLILKKYGNMELDSLLESAINNSNYEMIKKLINMGAKNVEECAKIAANKNDMEILKYFIGDIENDQGWLFNGRYLAKNYQNIIESAIYQESKNVINYMLEKEYKYDFNKLLKIASIADNKKISKRLIMQFKANNYEEALISAIGFGSGECALWLINKIKINNYDKAFILSNITGQFLFTKNLCKKVSKDLISSELDKINNLIPNIEDEDIKDNYITLGDILKEYQ